MSETKTLATVKLPKKSTTAVCLWSFPAPGAQVQPNWPILSRSGLIEGNSPKCPVLQVLEEPYGH
jgi:hypothetical protein